MNPIAAAAALMETPTESPPVRLATLNREAWLEALTEKLRPYFEDAGLPLPEEMYVAPGFPSKGAMARKLRRIGEHWQGRASADGKPHIFISPVLKTDMEVGETLVHELVHAALPAGTKHGPRFRSAMQRVGLVGKPTATSAGEELQIRLQQIFAQLGPYPHSALTAWAPEKKQTTRMRKVACEKHPDYIVRASKKTIDQGLPPCGLCWKEFTEAAAEGEGDYATVPTMTAEEGEEQAE
jgi:hypothetical protein